MAVRTTVATHDLVPGTRIGPADLATVDWPPPPGLGLVEDPVGRVVAQAVMAGEPIVAARVAPAGLDGTPALVPAGHRAVAVPVAIAVPPLRVGDVVDIHTTDGTGAVLTVTEEAVVVAVDTDAITVAANEQHVPMLAAGLASGTAVLALHGQAG